MRRMEVYLKRLGVVRHEEFETGHNVHGKKHQILLWVVNGNAERKLIMTSIPVWILTRVFKMKWTWGNRLRVSDSTLAHSYFLRSNCKPYSAASNSQDYQPCYYFRGLMFLIRLTGHPRNQSQSSKLTAMRARPTHLHTHQHYMHNSWADKCFLFLHANIYGRTQGWGNAYKNRSTEQPKKSCRCRNRNK